MTGSRLTRLSPPAPRRSFWILAAAWWACLPLGPPLAAQPSTRFQIVQVTGGLVQPVGVTHAGDGSGRLFIVEQTGRIRLWDGTTLRATPFLNISTLVGPCASPTDCGERGLLGLAFHPDYSTNGRFYVFYTRVSDGDLVVARYQVSGNPDLADAASGDVLLTIEHSANSNHNGGQLAFGPDGLLYAGTGDGGGSGDPLENGQSLSSLLGKVLRLDVDGDDFPADTLRDYAIPADNPFVGVAGEDEIWTWGMRNPWRFSFDRLTGDLFIADVGQNAFEEIDFQAASSAGGENYGWDCREGAHVYTGTDNDGNAGCAGVTFVDPILEYDHGLGCSVTGGSVYRGRVQSFLTGNYLFGDFCTGRIWRGVPGAGGSWSRVDLLDTGFGISSFGEGETGRIYFTDLFGDSLQWLQPFTFADAPPTAWFWRFAEALFAAGVSSGCGGGNFCPTGLTRREQMAVFLLRASEGSGFVPPPCTTPVFADVPCSSPFAPWINELAARGITAGCGGGNFCPGGAVSRGDMAVFLLRALEGSGFVPPPCTTPVFADVPCSNPLAPWINELAARGITAGCGGGNFCPTRSVNRAEMAVFLTATFGLFEVAP